MKEEEFLKLFGKTTLIEHLSKNQQRELYETVKELISKAKVTEVIDKIIEKHKENCSECKLRLGFIEGGTHCLELREVLDLKKELGLE